MLCVRPMPSKQRGLTMFGFLFVAVVLVAVAMLAMKLVPAYIEFFSVKKILATMGQDSDLRSKSNVEIRKDFSKRASVGYVTVVKPEDISIDRRRRRPGDYRRLRIPHQARRQCEPGGRLQRQFRSERCACSD